MSVAPQQLTLKDGMTLIYDGISLSAKGAAVTGVMRVTDTRDEKRAGLAHFVEHLLARHLRLVLLPAAVGMSPRLEDWDAITEMEQITITWGTGSDARLWKIAETFLVAFRRPLDALTPEAFEAERRRILVELSSHDVRPDVDIDKQQIRRIVLRQLIQLAAEEKMGHFDDVGSALRHMFPGTTAGGGLGVWDPGGVLADVEAVTYEHVQRYIGRHVVPHDCAVVVVAHRGADERREDESILRTLQDRQAE